MLELHRELLADAARVHAFEHALRARVRPGDVVVDLASGTGILGMLACRAGASRVYAIESSGIVEVAQRLARVNGYADRIRVLQSAVDDAELPEAPDGIVADQIGHFGYEAGLFEMFARARTWLKPGGWMVPQRIQFLLAPVTDDSVRARVASWASPVAGLDFSAASSFAANAIYPQTLDCDQLLGEAVVALDVPLAEADPRSLSARVTLPISRDGFVDGIGGWFHAELAPGVFMTNAPGAEGRLQRRNVVLPFESRCTVARGDRIDLQLRILPVERIVDWRGSVRARGVTVPFSHSTLKGTPFSRGDLHRLKPSHAPRLSERGDARRTVLELCDGSRAVAEIERTIAVQHATLFPNADAAAAFVADVIGRNAE